MLKPKLFVAFSFAIALMAITFVGAANQQAKIDPEIEKLLIQKKETLMTCLAVLGDRKKSPAERSRVRAELAKTEIELAKVKAERIKVLSAILEDQKQLERFAQDMVTIAGKPNDELMLVKANRIQAEIDLLRAKAGK